MILIAVVAIIAAITIPAIISYKAKLETSKSIECVTRMLEIVQKGDTGKASCPVSKRPYVLAGEPDGVRSITCPDPEHHLPTRPVFRFTKAGNVLFTQSFDTPGNKETALSSFGLRDAGDILLQDQKRSVGGFWGGLINILGIVSGLVLMLFVCFIKEEVYSFSSLREMLISLCKFKIQILIGLIVAGFFVFLLIRNQQGVERVVELKKDGSAIHIQQERLLGKNKILVIKPVAIVPITRYKEDLMSLNVFYKDDRGTVDHKELFLFRGEDIGAVSYLHDMYFPSFDQDHLTSKHD